MEPRSIEHELPTAIDAILADYPDATVGISLRDISQGIRYGLNQDRIFHAASTMKVPVLIELFRRVYQNRISLEDSLLVKNEFRSIIDGSLYSIGDDSDDAIYERLSQYMTLRDLSYQMITVSSNLATNLLIDYLTADSVQAAAERLGVKKMRVLRGVEDIKAYELGKSNTATSSDLATLFVALMNGKAVSPELDASMKDILKDQKFNEMIPAGLPPGSIVAHKTGQITGIHHDAGIIYPASGRPYVLVLLIEGITDEAVSARLGADLTAVIHAAVRPTAPS